MTAAVAERLRPCCACGLRRPPAEFFRDESRASGLSSRCRACAKDRFSRLAPSSPEAKRLARRKQERQRQRRERTDRSFYLRREARRRTRYAVKHGLIHRPTSCELCGADPGVVLDAHHPDHRDTLRVVFVCRGCHATLPHRRAEADERGAA